MVVKCNVCSKIVKSNQGILCVCCSCRIHKKCTSLCAADLQNLSNNSDWFCSDCLKGLFPYNHLESDFDFYRAINVDFTLLRNANSLRFIPFSVSEEKPLLNNGDLDPEDNFFNDFNLPESQYMTAVDFCTSSKQNSIMSTTFSVLHINCRSLNKKL